MKVKRLLAVGLAALMMISAAGCGSKDNGAQEAGNANTPAPAAESSAAIGERHTADGRTQINVGWNYAITSLAPFQAESPAKNLLYSTAVFETLAKYDQDGIIQPSLAKEWTQIDEDGFVYEVRLFDYIKDSEGNPITADDVIFCVDQINKSGTQTAYYNKLDSVEKKDDYTLVFNMNSNEYGDFDMILNYCIVVSKDAFEKSGDEMATAIIATGPYKVTGFVNSSTVTIEKNENYWQTDDTLKQPYAAQNVDVIEVTCIPEESQQEVALETGSIDFMNEMAAHSIDQLAGYSNITSRIVPAANQYFFYLSASGPLANENLRKAVSYAIDENAVNEAAYEGAMIPCNFGMKLFGDYNDKWDEEDYYGYDVEKARELIKQENAEGTHIRIVATGTGVTMDEVIQAYLIDAGFDAELVEEELATYLTDALNPDAYDIICITPFSTSNIGMWKILMDQRNYENGTTVNGFKDDTLQAMLEKTGSVEGHTEENMDELYHYLVDKCYVYSAFGASVTYMWRTDGGLKDFTTQFGGLPYIGGFTYTWN